MARIAISYHLDSESHVLQIAHALREFNFDIRLVVKDRHQDAFKNLEEAMRESAVVLVCLTSKYEMSKDCIMELNYAANLKKELIPIYLEKCYRASGEVSQRVADKRCIDFTDPTDFLLNTKMLKIEIENRLSRKGIAANPGNLCIPVQELGATGMGANSRNENNLFNVAANPSARGMGAYAGHIINVAARSGENRMDANAEDATNAVANPSGGAIAQNYTEIKSFSGGVSVSGGNINSQSIRMDANSANANNAVANPGGRSIEGMNDNAANASNASASHIGRGIAQNQTAIGSMHGGVNISGGNINTQIIHMGSRSDNGN